MRNDAPHLGISSKGKMCPTGHLYISAQCGHTIQMSANNIALYRKRANLSQSELAELIGTTLNMLGKLERGDRTLDTDWLNKIGRALSVEPHMLIASAPTGEFTEPVESSKSETVELQKLDLSLSMGAGTIIEDYIEAELVTFDLRFIQSITRAPAHRLKLVTGIGDSMYPTLNWGDAIMIDTSDRQLTKQDGIYWINLYGAAGLKRLRAIGPNRILVKSDNPSVGDQEVEADDLRIDGRAIWVARGL